MAAEINGQANTARILHSTRGKQIISTILGRKELRSGVDTVAVTQVVGVCSQNVAFK